MVNSLNNSITIDNYTIINERHFILYKKVILYDSFYIYKINSLNFMNIYYIIL